MLHIKEPLDIVLEETVSFSSKGKSREGQEDKPSLQSQ